MKTIPNLKTLPLLGVLISGLALTPALASAGSDNERKQVSGYSQQSKHRHARSGDHRGDHNGAAHRQDQRAQHPHNRGQHHQPERHAVNRHHNARHYHSRNPVVNHHHSHSVVRNYYRPHVYTSVNPRLILGLHNDNISIFYRNH